MQTSAVGQCQHIPLALADVNLLSLREISNNKRSGTYARRKVKPVVSHSNLLRLHPVMRRQNVAVILNRKCKVAMEQTDVLLGMQPCTKLSRVPSLVAQ